MPKFDTDLKSCCGHKGDRIVRYAGADENGVTRLNSICSPCLSAGIYYVQEVEGDFDVLLEGGHTVTIQMPKEQ